MSSVRVTFYGAAGEVTGSKFLITTDKHRVLIDCGLFQGRKDLRLLNWERPKFEPRDIDAIVLTHAHIDHTGFLPAVVKGGFKGPIYCTPATQELVQIMLVDSAHLQEEEARFANIHGTSKHHPARPLYDQKDVKDTLALIRPIERDQSTEILPGFRVFPRCAGHILGSTTLTIDVQGKRLNFSGDIGRYDSPILPDPAPIELGDLLLCESTYGDREHPDVDSQTELKKIVLESIERGGPLLIPAFAVGRTQNLLYYLHKLEQAGEIPELPVYVDSPMAVSVTEIYRRHLNDYDEEAKARLKNGGAAIVTSRTTLTQSVDESKRLNSLKGPRIIISASGMATGGRILHHLTRWLPDERSTVLLVGYQAEGTRGRKLLDGEHSIKIFAAMVPVRATVRTMSSLSAHGDRSELLRWLKSSTGTPAQVKIIHGERASSQAFAKTVEKELGWRASVAEYLETVDV